MATVAGICDLALASWRCNSRRVSKVKRFIVDDESIPYLALFVFLLLLLLLLLWLSSSIIDVDDLLRRSAEESLSCCCPSILTDYLHWII